MAFNKDPIGIFMFWFAYFMLAIMDTNVVFTSFYDKWGTGQITPFIVSGLFQVIVWMVLWAHISCMVTDPGYLPKEVKEIDVEKLNPRMQTLYKLTQTILEKKKSKVYSINNNEELKEEERKEVIEEDKRKEVIEEEKEHILVKQ